MEPQKRKNVDKNLSCKEIRDNIKKFTQSKKNNYYRTDSDSTTDLSNNFSSGDSDEEETVLDSSLDKNKTYNLSNEKKYRKENISSKEKEVKLNKTITTQYNKDSYTNKLTILFVLFVFISIVVYKYFIIEKPTENDKSDKMTNLEINIKNNKISYQNQKQEFWKWTYASLASRIQDPEKPSIIILLGNETSTLYCLANMLASISSNTLSTGVLELTPEKFEPDIGAVIDLLRSNTRSKKVVIIYNLLHVNIEALRAFHNLCDRINPLVKDIVLIITVNIDTYENKNLSPVKVIEDELVKKLSNKIKADSIPPLITRITDGHILLTNPEPYKNYACPSQVMNKPNSWIDYVTNRIKFLFHWKI